MKAVIFAGGFGTRISEESGVRPKPMVEIGGKPILWHIMKMYSFYGINDFIILLGYKSHVIKEYFANYGIFQSDVTFDYLNNTTHIHSNGAEPWKVTLVETGENTMTGGRLLKAKKYIGDETFCLTYGDGVSDLDIDELIRFHKKTGSKATLTAVQPPGRFGTFSLQDDKPLVMGFREKPQGDGAWINGGFFVLEPSVIDSIEGDQTVWEQEPLKLLSQEGQLSAYRHEGFWQPLDSLRDKNVLEEIWKSGKAPWKKW